MFGQTPIPQNVVASTPSWFFDPNAEDVPGIPNISLLLLAAAVTVIFFTPEGYYQVREKKTGKRVGPRMYHY
jgi:hypothetical protein